MVDGARGLMVLGGAGASEVGGEEGGRGTIGERRKEGVTNF